MGGGYKRYLQLIKEHHLNISFVHLGYRVAPGIATIWEDGPEGDKLIEDYLEDLNTVAKDGIKLVCMHVTKSRQVSPLSEIGLKRWEKIVRHAEKLGVTVALENTKWPGYLEFICDNIKSPNLKICLDTGHNHFHFKDNFNFDRFKDMIACVHLHDNDSTADQHLIPFDGTIDWKRLSKNLKNSGFCGDMASEAVYQKEYSKIPPEEFYKTVLQRLHKIDEMMK